MTRKLLIGLALAVILSCAVTIALFQRLTDDRQVTTLAHQIADFNLPEGYQPDYAVEMLGYTVAAYRSGDAHLTLLQAPPGIVPDEQSIQSYGTNENIGISWRDESLVFADQRVVREHPAQMTLTDRTNGSGQRYRSLNMVFQGQLGAALLVINQPLAQWDNEAVEAFIGSIR